MRLKAASLLLFLSLGAAYACSSPSPADAAAGTSSKVTSRPFDKNDVVDDVSLTKVDAMSAAEVQKLLEKTPWGTRSVLADYAEGGKTAAEIMVSAAAKHGLNPLAMLVRVQMEQGLVSHETASASTIAIAFGCGCPHSPVCNDSYMGFANQAECAAGTLARSLARAVTSEGTVSGWARGRTKETEDGIEVTPKNAATAALYTYTPWVGEAGGGRAGVGGASLHFAVWDRFSSALADRTQNTQESNEAETNDVDAAAPEPTPEDVDAGNTEDATSAEDAGTTATPDAGAPRPDAGPAQASTSDGADDSEILGEGNAPPASNAPPPSSTSGHRAPEELPEATEEELAGKPKSSQGGCATTGRGPTEDALVIVLAAAAAVGACRRRRSV